LVIQLKVLSGKKAGTCWVARRFPVRIGRAPGVDLQLEEAGVWDTHLQLDFKPGEGFLLKPQPSALTSVNGHSIEQALLRNGDVLGVGSVKLQFWLGDTRQRGLAFREWLTWTAIAAICFGQVYLIYLLLRG
jgi:hypothetical protein